MIIFKFPGFNLFNTHLFGEELSCEGRRPHTSSLVLVQLIYPQNQYYQPINIETGGVK
jgi:hypothetical protein